jgi:hypothetical protein
MRVGGGTLSDMRSGCSETGREMIDAIWRVGERCVEERHAVLMSLVLSDGDV